MSNVSGSSTPDSATNEPLPVIEVVAGIIWQGEQFLASKRVPPSPLAGFWEFPGGKRKVDETFEQALIRELDEELGIRVQELSAWLTTSFDYNHEGYRVILHFFHVTKHTGQALAREGQILRWVTPEQAKELPFLPADAPIIEQIAALKTPPTT